jgi:hypothetical protein
MIVGNYIREELLDIPEFSAWLQSVGCTLEELKTGDLIRFRLPNGKTLNLQKANKSGEINLSTITHIRLVSMFLRSETYVNWQEFAKNKRETVIERLAARDGGLYCMYCGKKLIMQETSIEHVVPQSKGGPNSLENMVIACKACNTKAGSLSVAEKMRLMRLKTKDMRSLLRFNDEQAARAVLESDIPLGLAAFGFIIALLAAEYGEQVAGWLGSVTVYDLGESFEFLRLKFGI